MDRPQPSEGHELSGRRDASRDAPKSEPQAASQGRDGEGREGEAPDGGARGAESSTAGAPAAGAAARADAGPSRAGVEPKGLTDDLEDFGFGRPYAGGYGPNYDPAFDPDADDLGPAPGAFGVPGAPAPARYGEGTGEEMGEAGDEMSAVQRDVANGVTQHEGLEGRAVDVLRGIFDPEIPVNIYDLGLIYEVRESTPGKIYVRMTLTSPMCPVAGSLPPEVKQRLEAEAGAKEAVIDIVWDPPWHPNKMSEAARLQLNFF